MVDSTPVDHPNAAWDSGYRGPKFASSPVVRFPSAHQPAVSESPTNSSHRAARGVGARHRLPAEHRPDPYGEVVKKQLPTVFSLEGLQVLLRLAVSLS